MWERARAIVSSAVRDFSRSWRSLVITSIAYKAISFALLAPATALSLRWLLSGRGSTVVADADIARFFVTTPRGVTFLVVACALVGAITAVESACLMAIGLAAARGGGLDARSALRFGARRAHAVLRLVANMVARVLLGILPFAVAGGLVYWTLLRKHDINYYLSQRPPTFWVAAVLAVGIVAALAALLVRTILRWALALPLVLFERAWPALALGASAARSSGARPIAAIVLGAWAVGSLALTFGSTALIEALGRAVAPRVAGSLSLLLLFLSVFLLLWAVLALAIAVVQSSFFALLVVRLYLDAGPAADPAVQDPFADGPGIASRRLLSPRGVALFAAAGLSAAAGVALLALVVTRGEREVSVIAHRGASAAAPENSLAAFRLAAEEGADFVELDVQETVDGEVLVVHDSDLMKVAGVPWKVWEATAAELRAVDIGSHKGERFAGERVPTLAEALAACKGRAHVIVELKSYGHDQRLEERVAAVVEAAGMEDDCAYMSMDHRMVSRMKTLRPGWRVGVLVAKALGDVTTLDADFLAVEAGMVNARFVRRAHRAGMDVYAWTVNDPASMLRVMSFGADGLITDVPGLAKEVVARRARMSDAQRLAAALLLRLGVRSEALESEAALRP